MLERGTTHLTKMAESLDFPWETAIDDPRRMHNMYARNLITCYVSKFAELSHAILKAVEQSHYLVYALCGRALIETTATLWYYVHKRYRPLLEQGPLNDSQLRKLLEIDDQHLRGSRFDWDDFLFQNYAKLRQQVVDNLREKRKKGTPSAQETIIAPQVNVLTCVESWAMETPEVLIVYNLFCDLVHPNIGSTMLVASSSNDRLYFSKFRGEPLGRAIVEQSLPMLLSLTQKPLGDLLPLLASTVWHDAEFEPEKEFDPLQRDV